MEFRQLSVDLEDMDNSRFDEFRYIFTFEKQRQLFYMPKQTITIKNREFYVSRFRLIWKNL